MRNPPDRPGAARVWSFVACLLTVLPTCSDISDVVEPLTAYSVEGSGLVDMRNDTVDGAPLPLVFQNRISAQRTSAGTASGTVETIVSLVDGHPGVPQTFQSRVECLFIEDATAWIGARVVESQTGEVRPGDRLLILVRDAKGAGPDIMHFELAHNIGNPRCTDRPRQLAETFVDFGDYSVGPERSQRPAAAGTVHFHVSTRGFDRDPDGYDIAVDDWRHPIGVDGTLTLSGLLPPGTYRMGIDGLAPHCVVAGDNPRAISVVADQTLTVAFTIECHTVTATLRVTATTAGIDPDPDGYTAFVEDGLQSHGMAPLAPNGSATIRGLGEGAHLLSLRGVAANCAVDPPDTVRIDLVAREERAAGFSITCDPVTRLAYASNSAGGGADIYAIDSNGTNITLLTDHPARDEDPAWSPDGNRIAFTSDRDGYHRAIYVMNADGSHPVRLTTSTDRADYRPAWSPDGGRIAFVSERNGNAELYVMDADGANQLRLTNHRALDTDPAWSPDGARIAFTSERDGNAEIYLMLADGSGVTRVTRDDVPDRHPAWSPDGTSLAFASQACVYYFYEYCHPAIIVWNVGLGAASTTVVGAGDEPAWSPDGSKIAVRGHNCYYVCSLAGIQILGLTPSSLEPVLTTGPHGRPTWRR